MKPRNCLHRLIEICTERDSCSWVKCCSCGFRGPRKHSYQLALVCWIAKLSSDHPSRRRARA